MKRKNIIKINQGLKALLTAVISVELAVGGFYMQPAHAANPPPDNQSRELAEKLAREAAEDPATIRKINRAADILDRGGSLAEMPDYDPDPVGAEDQFVEINGVTYDFSNPHAEIPPVAFTDLKVVYDPQQKLLIFEGYRGLNEQGTGGTLVARHIKRVKDKDAAFQIVAQHQDEEMLTLVGTNGQIHAAAMDYIAGAVFKLPIVFAKNAWEPSANLNLTGSKFTIKTGATFGTKPIREEDTLAGVLPRENGNIKIKASDIVLYANGQVVGVFSKYITYSKIVNALQFMLKRVMLKVPAAVEAKVAEPILKALAKQDAADAFEERDSTIAEPTRRMLVHVANGTSLLQKSIGQQFLRQSRQAYPLQMGEGGEWETIYNGIVQTAREQSDQLAVILDDQSITKKKREDVLAQQEEINKLLESGDFTSVWQDYYSRSNVIPSVAKQKEKSREWVKKVTAFSVEYLLPFAVIGGFFGYPLIYEASEWAKQNAALSWTYTHLIPPVLKSSEYRIDPLLYGTFALLALWPLTVATSWAAGRGIRIAAAVMSNSSSKTAQVVRDMAKKWAPLTGWGRIFSAQMRVYGTAIYPAIRAGIKYAIVQPQMIIAWSKGLNPFATIQPNSSVGRQLGITEPMKVGISRPFKEGRAEVQATQVKAMGILAERKARIESLAWHLAAVIVSQKENIDPATIQMILVNGYDPKNIARIFSRVGLRADWENTTEKILDVVENIGDGYFDHDLKDITPEMLEKYTKYILAIVQKVKEDDKNQELTSQRWQLYQTRAKVMSKRTAKYFLNLGYDASNFLRSIFTNKYVTEQSKQAAVPDYILGVVIYAFWGARADLARPELLAASKDGFLKTPGPHWVDNSFAWYLNTAVAPSRMALTVQQVKTKDSELYNPPQYLWSQNASRVQGLWRTSYEWVKNTLDVRQSDIGTYADRGYRARVAMIQANWGISMALRLPYWLSKPDLGVGQALWYSFMGFGLVFGRQSYDFAYPWEFIISGNRVSEARIENMKAERDIAFGKIGAAALESDYEKSREGYNELIGLFAKYNPEAIRNMLAFVSLKGYADLVNEYSSTFKGEDLKFLGLIARLYTALKSQNPDKKLQKAKVEEAAGILRVALLNKGESAAELEKLNAGSLLDFALENQPVYTAAHGLISWFTNFVLGAFLTTYLSTELFAMSFDTTKLTLPNVAFWFAASAVAFWTAGKTLSRNGPLAKGLDKVEEWWQEHGISQKIDRAKDVAVNGVNYRNRIENIDRQMRGEAPVADTTIASTYNKIAETVSKVNSYDKIKNVISNWRQARRERAAEKADGKNSKEWKEVEAIYNRMACDSLFSK